MATKEAYAKKLEAQLKQWDAKLETLSAKAQKATANARISYENELESLKRKRAHAHKTLENLGKRGDDAWEDLKDGAEQLWADLGKSLEKFASRFK